MVYKFGGLGKYLVIGSSMLTIGCGASLDMSHKLLRTKPNYDETVVYICKENEDGFLEECTAEQRTSIIDNTSGWKYLRERKNLPDPLKGRKMTKQEFKEEYEKGGNVVIIE